MKNTLILFFVLLTCNLFAQKQKVVYTLECQDTTIVTVSKYSPSTYECRKGALLKKNNKPFEFFNSPVQAKVVNGQVYISDFSGNSEIVSLSQFPQPYSILEVLQDIKKCNESKQLDLIPYVIDGDTTGFCVLYSDGSTQCVEIPCGKDEAPSITMPDTVFSDKDNGAGEDGTEYPPFDLSDGIVSTDCEPYTYAVTSMTNATVVESFPNITITPTGTPWNVDYTVTCSDGSTMGSNNISGTSAPAMCDEVSDFLPNSFDMVYFQRGSGSDLFNLLSSDTDNYGDFSGQSMVVDWGDGTIQTLPIPTGANQLVGGHTYSSVGVFPSYQEYNVSVTLTDINGNDTVINTTLAATSLPQFNLVLSAQTTSDAENAISTNCDIQIDRIVNQFISGSSGVGTPISGVAGQPAGAWDYRSINVYNSPTSVYKIYDASNALVYTNTSTNMPVPFASMGLTLGQTYRLDHEINRSYEIQRFDGTNWITINTVNPPVTTISYTFEFI